MSFDLSFGSSWNLLLSILQFSPLPKTLCFGGILYVSIVCILGWVYWDLGCEGSQCVAGECWGWVEQAQGCVV